jgi:hypothetical protein
MDRKKRASAIFFMFFKISKHMWSGVFKNEKRSFFFGPFWTVLRLRGDALAAF